MLNCGFVVLVNKLKERTILALQQFMRCSEFDYPSCIYNEDAVIVHDCVKAVCNG